jgi:hypothetical protein
MRRLSYLCALIGGGRLRGCGGGWCGGAGREDVRCFGIFDVRAKLEGVVQGWRQIEGIERS